MPHSLRHASARSGSAARRHDPDPGASLTRTILPTSSSGRVSAKVRLTAATARPSTAAPYVECASGRAFRRTTNACHPCPDRPARVRDNSDLSPTTPPPGRRSTRTRALGPCATVPWRASSTEGKDDPISRRDLGAIHPLAKTALEEGRYSTRLELAGLDQQEPILALVRLEVRSRTASHTLTAIVTEMGRDPAGYWAPVPAARGQGSLDQAQPGGSRRADAAEFARVPGERLTRAGRAGSPGCDLGHLAGGPKSTCSATPPEPPRSGPRSRRRRGPALRPPGPWARSRSRGARSALRSPSPRARLVAPVPVEELANVRRFEVLLRMPGPDGRPSVYGGTVNPSGRRTRRRRPPSLPEAMPAPSTTSRPRSPGGPDRSQPRARDARPGCRRGGAKGAHT